MSSVQCISAYPQRYKLTHDISLDSLNDIDNDIALTPTTNGYPSWITTGPNHGPNHSLDVADNHYTSSVINANNVRNTDAHGQSSSWVSRSDYTRAGPNHAECISDYAGRGCYHKNTECESIRRCEPSDYREGVKRKEGHPVQEYAVDSGAGRRCYTAQSSVEDFDLTGRQQTAEISADEAERVKRCHSPHGARKGTETPPGCYSSQSSVDEAETTRKRYVPSASLDDEYSSTQRPLSRSSQEDDGGPPHVSRQDSKVSDTSYSNESSRRHSEDGSDSSQRMVRTSGRSSRGSRKGRRPRKLPEIPTNAKPTTITFMTANGALKCCHVSQLANFLTEFRDNKESELLQRSLSIDRSLADELHEADPSLKLSNSTPSVLRSDESSPDSNVEFEQPQYRTRKFSASSRCHDDPRDDLSNSERDIMSMSTSTNGSQITDSEFKVKSEEWDKETYKRDSREFDESYDYVNDMASSSGAGYHRDGMQRHLSDNARGPRASGSANQALLSSDSVFPKEDSSPEERPQARRKPSTARPSRKSSVDTPGRRSSTTSTMSVDMEELDASHRGCHKFIPRHPDELFIEIGDPIHVQVEDDDLWCTGYNLRTCKYGIFPSAYATDLSFLEGEEGGIRPVKFFLRFLGSVEVAYHKGTEVLVQAINKVALTRRSTLNGTPPPLVMIEINEHGIKMTDKSKKKEKVSSDGSDVQMSPGRRAASIRARLAKILSKEKEPNHNHFFSLKNVSFCGYHPRNERYFAFITKHPLEMRFACHVYLCEHSTKSIVDAVGTAFRQFYSQYMAFVHPTEDIYIE